MEQRLPELQCSRKFSKIFLIGDSQTQDAFSEQSGWGSIISNHFQRRCDVLNRGLYGYNTRWVKLVLNQLIDEANVEKIAAVVIFLGSNDANSKAVFPQYHVPLAEYKSLLGDMVDYITDLGVSREKIILVSAPPFDEEQWIKTLIANGDAPLSGLDNVTLKLYAEACNEVAAEKEVNSVDLFSEMISKENWKKYVCDDGLHLAKEGGKLLAEMLIQKLDKICEKHTTWFPHCDSIDNENPAPSFGL